MKIAIIGTGGAGGYFGGKCAAAGLDVTFVARGKHLEAMKANGLTVKSIGGDFVVPSVKAVPDIQSIETPGLVIMGVKAWQVQGAAQELSSVTGEDTMILPLQNGISAAPEIAAETGEKHALGGTCRILSKIESPGVIHHFGTEPALVFGELDRSSSQRTVKLKELFDSAGIKSRISMDIHVDLWKKFIGICISGLLAITQSPYGAVRELPETRRMMRDLLTEIYTLGIKENINLAADTVDKTLSNIDALPYDSTSSLTRDVWAARPSEIHYQNGTVVKLGEKHGIPTPVNRFVYTCILPRELRARKK